MIYKSLFELFNCISVNSLAILVYTFAQLWKYAFIAVTWWTKSPLKLRNCLWINKSRHLYKPETFSSIFLMFPIKRIFTIWFAIVHSGKCHWAIAYVSLHMNRTSNRTRNILCMAANNFQWGLPSFLSSAVSRCLNKVRYLIQYLKY